MGGYCVTVSVNMLTWLDRVDGRLVCDSRNKQG